MTHRTICGDYMKLAEELWLTVTALITDVGWQTIKEVVKIAAEKTFENKVKKFLESQGAWHVKFFANSYTKSGIPDILACVNGYFVGIEVKAQNGKPSELQLYNVNKIREAGGFAMVLYPSGFAKFKEFIIELKKDNFTREMEEIWK